MFILKLVLIYLGCVSTEAGRILAVFPTPFISHQVVFRPLTQELARRGHEVIVITADPAFPKGKTPENLTEIDVHDLSYKVWREAMFTGATRGESKDINKQVSIMLPTLSKIFEMEMMTNEVQSVIANRSNHFDLLIIEACVRPAVSLTHLFKAPTILVSSFGGINYLFDVIGAPVRPVLLYPTSLRQRLFNLTLWEKLRELYHHYDMERLFNLQVENDDKVVRRLFGPDTPAVSELMNNIDMLFLNVHPIWEFNRPVPSNVLFMGGLHQTPTKELPQDLKTYLDSSKHGVIYISFGTNVDPTLLPPERVQVLVRAFSQLPYDVLWKWNKDELPGRSENIKISKWLPQSDLLKHPKIKLFITQGGLQSTDEAISAGVPLIGMPMLGDQWFNVEQYVHRKIGLRLDLETLTVDNFKEAINTVIKDDSFRKNMIKLRSLMRDQPQSPLERSVWWSEHLMRHGGGSHLRPLTANISWSEYLDLELIFFLGTSALIIVIAICIMTYLLFNFVRRNLLTSSKLKKS